MNDTILKLGNRFGLVYRRRVTCTYHLVVIVTASAKLVEFSRGFRVRATTSKTITTINLTGFWRTSHRCFQLLTDAAVIRLHERFRRRHGKIDVPGQIIPDPDYTRVHLHGRWEISGLPGCTLNRRRFGSVCLSRLFIRHICYIKKSVNSSVMVVVSQTHFIVYLQQSTWIGYCQLLLKLLLKSTFCGSNIGWYLNTRTNFF